MAFVTILLPGLIAGLVMAGLVWTAIYYLSEKYHPTGSAPVGMMISGLILIFAFVVGITVSQESTQLNAASAAASNEANSVGELYWYAHVLSEPEHTKLQDELRSYTTIVANQEWPLLGQHQSLPAAAAAVRDIRFDVLGFRPGTPAEQAVYGNMLTQVGNLFAARRARNDIATTGGVAPVLLDGIILLAVLTLLVVPLTGKIKSIVELVIYGLFVTFLVSTLFLLVDLNNPFQGNVAVKPTAFNILFTGTFKNVP